MDCDGLSFLSMILGAMATLIGVLIALHTVQEGSKADWAKFISRGDKSPICPGKY